MSAPSPKRKNVYLDKINENLVTFFKQIEKFDQVLNELSQLSNGAIVHINDIERILGSNEDEDTNDDTENAEQQFMSHHERESIAGEKLCQLNDNLNTSIREIRQSWNTLEKQCTAISKSVYQLPKLIRLFLDTTKNDPDFNDLYFRSEMIQLSDQFSIIGQLYYELCLEIQVKLLDISTMKKLKDLAITTDLLLSRSLSVSVPIQIIRQIQTKLI